MNKVILTGDNLTIQYAVNICRNNYKVEISQESRDKIVEMRNHIECKWICDDAPPDHMVSVMIGYEEAEAYYKGERMNAL